MTLYPDVQARAQQELDRVVGKDRLPTWEDRFRLPFVGNVVKETLRWKSVTPLGSYLIDSPNLQPHRFLLQAYHTHC